MKAWILNKFGYDGINLREVDKPVAGFGEVVIRVLACGICYRDIIDIQGGFKYTVLPTVPGHEICGVVEQIGEKVENLSKGDIVISRHGAFCGKCELCLSGNDNLCITAPQKFVHSIPGGYAEYVKAPESAFEKIPPTLHKKFSPAELSTIFCAVGTAFRALVSQAQVKPGDTVLITGAGGGVGVHAVQIAKFLGAYTIAITTSTEKAERLKLLGADEVILATKQNLRFNEQVMSITGGRGVDAVIENTGSIGLEAAIRSLKIGGTLVLVGNIKVDRYPLNPGMVITRELKLKGTVGITHNELQNLFKVLEYSNIKPIVHAEFPLENMMDAHKYLTEGKTFGRIALKPT